MAKTTKNCLNCGKAYVTNYFSERSKYCSRVCLSKHKKVLKRERLHELRKVRRQEAKERGHEKERRAREEQLKEITAANKAIEAVRLEDDKYGFGDTVLTLKNYKEPLAKIPPEIGIGWYGTLAADVKTGKVQCHLCGQFLESLPGHIFSTHKMKTREYREKFGLAYTTALVSESHRMLLKQKTIDWLKNMTPEEKEEYKQRLKRVGRENAHKSRGTLGLKKTMEGMNKDGSCPDQTLDAIIKVKEELGHVPSKKEFIAHKKSQRYVHLAYKHFGSWNKAIEMCHFDAKDDDREQRRNAVHRNGGRSTYTDDDLLEYLRIYAQEYGQIPTASDWKRDLLPGYDTYLDRFGDIETARQLAGVYDIVEKSKTFLMRSKHYRGLAT